MAKLLSYLIACLLLLTIVHGESASCAAHPAYLVAKDFYARETSKSRQGNVFGPKFLDSYFAASPSIKNAEDLGVCSQYAGQTSCCSKDMVAFIDRASTVTGNRLIQADSIIMKFARLNLSIIQKHSCSTKASSAQYDDLYDNTAFTKMKQMDEGTTLCKIQFTKAISRITRGGMCAMCMGFEKVTDFIKEGKVVILESSRDAYMADVHAAFTCMAAITENETLVGEAIDQIVDYYTTGESCSSGTITTIKSKISEIFLQNKTDGKDSEGNDTCSGQVLFSERKYCEYTIFGNSFIDSIGQQYNPSSRLLQEPDTIDTGVSASTGIDSYIESENDNLINAEGNYHKTFNSIYANSTSNSTTPTSGYNVVQTTFNLRLLCLTQLLGLVMLLSF